MKRPYVPDLDYDGHAEESQSELRPCRRYSNQPLAMVVTIVEVTDRGTNKEDVAMHALRNEDGLILTSSEVAQITNAIRPFYLEVPDDVITAANEGRAAYEAYNGGHSTSSFYKAGKQLRRPDREGCVYVISAGPYYKIGRAKIVSKRLAVVEPLLPFKTELLFCIATDDMIILERQLHERFADKRSNGEWFTLDQEDIEYIKALMPEEGEDARQQD